MNASTIPDEQSPSHPFGELLEPGESLLWLARPNPDAFRVQQAKVFLFIFGFGATGALFFGVWPFKSPAAAVYAAFALICVLIGGVLASRIASGDEEWSITWYALTPQRLLKQFLDTDAEGGRRIVQVALTDICRLRLQKRYARLGTSIGTITCYTSARFVREHFTLDAIENPDEVLGLIEEARAKVLAASQSIQQQRLP